MFSIRVVYTYHRVESLPAGQEPGLLQIPEASQVEVKVEPSEQQVYVAVEPAQVPGSVNTDAESTVGGNPQSVKRHKHILKSS